MTTIETTTTAALVDITTLKAVCIAASTDQARPALSAVAFTVNDDRWALQATDSHVAVWTGDAPAADGHHLVSAKALTGAVRTVGAKRGLVSVAFSDLGCTITGPDGALTLSTIPADFPRLDRLVSSNVAATETIGFTDLTMGKVCAITKLVGAGFALSFDGNLKPATVRFMGDPDLHMIVMPYRVNA